MKSRRPDLQSIGDSPHEILRLLAGVKTCARRSALLWLLLFACDRHEPSQLARGGTRIAEARAPARPLRERSTLAGSSGAAAADDAPSDGGESAGVPATDDVGVAVCEPLGESDTTKVTRFAVFGDYGSGPGTLPVSELVESWRVDFILTAGDNNYPVGGRDTIDGNIGRYYSDYICPYRGDFGRGARKNRFFPALGNHDWYTAGARPFLDYFSLPGNERYYDLVWGNVHAFVLDSDPSEPDGVMSDSLQATWLSKRLAASVSPWKIVVMHHPPYSSGLHGSSGYMRWPFKQWGINLVIAGHDHDYERFDIDGLPQVVVGLGGASTYGFNATASGSRSQFDSNFGAGLVEADESRLVFRFVSVDHELLDTFTLGAP